MTEYVKPRSEQPSIEGIPKLRVKLLTALQPFGTADAVITVPIEPADPTSPNLEEDDLWEELDLEEDGSVIRGIRNGIPMEDTIEADLICWIELYLGRWCVTAIQCET